MSLKKKASARKARNIFRIDVHATHGWQVRIQRQNKSYTQFFSDKKYGSPKKAFEAALAYRDQLLQELPPPIDPTARLRTPEVRQKAAASINRSGVIGIGFSVKVTRQGIRRPYVQGYWIDADGRRRATSRSIEAHGLKGALELVCRKLYEVQANRGLSVEEMVQRALPTLEQLYRQTQRDR
ncbi:AP2 domain-containing protein [Rhodothermus marinus]|uniref:AP2 domain-containing protein n=1 Tax=Rhodothermus marinus TaxID=29549 RepID=UPI0037C6BAF7